MHVDDNRRFNVVQKYMFGSKLFIPVLWLLWGWLVILNGNKRAGNGNDAGESLVDLKCSSHLLININSICLRGNESNAEQVPN